MAKWIEQGKTLLVEAGDTLSEIAQDYFGGVSKTDQLAALNNIANKNLIYVGQTISLVGGGSSSSGSSVNSSAATIKQFGVQSNSDGTLFATWDWSMGHTDHYETEWCYDTGDSVWFVGSKSSTEEKQSTYSIPSNAKKVRFRVKPVSKTYTSNNKEASYWTASWSTAKTYDVSNLPPSKPGTPDVDIEKYKLTVTLDNVDATELNATGIQFQIVKNDTTIYKTGKATINTSVNFVTYSCTVDAGAEYKVRCRSYRGNAYSEWTDFSGNVKSIPAAPSGIKTIKATSETSIYLEWSAVTGAESYELEYAVKKEYFDRTDQTTKKSGIELTYFELIGLESGEEYFFRVRSVNTKGESAWTGIKSVTIGKKPAAPTTWSSTTTAVTGEPLKLYWVHNSEDNSSQTYAELELYVNGLKNTYTIKNSEDEEEKDKTSVYEIDTKVYNEGTKLQWRVRTAGITKVYGDWSVERTVDIYAPPTLALEITDTNGNDIQILERFPMNVRALAGPNTQSPTGYNLTITANDIYETTDHVGNPKTVNKGEAVYLKYFDISEELSVSLSASDLDLENNIEYTITCVVSMDSGLTAESSIPFTVMWTDEIYTPNAEISLDRDTLVTHIKPYCVEYTLFRYEVKNQYGVYTKTATMLSSVYGSAVPNVKTATGEQVYYGTTEDGAVVYYCEVIQGTTGKGVTLSVYRREFDGSFTELATGIDNTRNVFVTDPHPALDYARYRIVATTISTGAISFYDVPAYPVGETAIIIQWDEAWSNFDVSSEDAMEQPAWAGSLLKLPYNIDTSDRNTPDVTLTEYIGRKHPVSYYGTQLGETASWKVDIPADDVDTLYALRRLKIWMGDVYVREPSGSGYWAHVTVSFSQTHCEVIIPVTIDITRVEGGA